MKSNAIFVQVSLALALLAGCDGPVAAEAPATQQAAADLPNVVLERVGNSGGYDGLRGWHEEMRAGFRSRLIPDRAVFAGASLSVVWELPSDFESSLAEALALEGVSKVSVLAQIPLSSDYSSALLALNDLEAGSFASVIGRGEREGQEVKFAGIWMNAPGPGERPDRAATFEFFVAPTAKYEALGGWLVPALRGFDLDLKNPPPMRDFGAAPDAEQVGYLDLKFRTWITEIVQQRSMTSLMHGQILRMQQGLDQVEPYGLQDPMYDPNF